MNSITMAHSSNKKNTFHGIATIRTYPNGCFKSCESFSCVRKCISVDSDQLNTSIVTFVTFSQNEKEVVICIINDDLKNYIVCGVIPPRYCVFIPNCNIPVSKQSFITKTITFSNKKSILVNLSNYPITICLGDDAIVTIINAYFNDNIDTDNDIYNDDTIAFCKGDDEMFFKNNGISVMTVTKHVMFNKCENINIDTKFFENHNSYVELARHFTAWKLNMNINEVSIQTKYDDY